jgi:hypothetical protein
MPGHGCTARAGRTRWAWLLAGLGLLAAAGSAAPAEAAGPSDTPTLTLSHLWNQTERAGAWSPYVATVRNDGQSTFSGTVVLVADASYRGPIVTFPEYDASIVVPAGGQRSATIYPVESVGGYHAELHDGQGGLVASASSPATGGSGPAVAIVSDVSRVDQRLDALLRSQSQLDAGVTQFATGQAFPAAAIRLSGLNAVILDQFDTGSLSQQQLRALADFVGLGGTLIVAGGARAARTLGPLPGSLVPLRPTGAATATLAPLGDLSGFVSTATAPVTIGDVAPGARVTLAAPDGTPLIVEGAYGAGDVVELAFDPLAAPFDNQLDLAGAAWTQALTRGLSAAAGSGSMQLGKLAFGGGPPFGGPLVGSGPGSATGYAGFLDEAMTEAPAAGTPPLDLLAGLLVLYVVVVSGLAYSVLRSVGRRGLLWVVVPAIAVVCTAGAYQIGFGTRGSDFQVVQVQVERLGPGGVVETSEYDGVLTPRRGDVMLIAPSDTLVSTVKTSIGSFQGSYGDPARISVAGAPAITFPNVPVWDVRPVETLSETHLGTDGGTAMPIEARLSLRSGRLQGQVLNHTARGVRDLQLVSSTVQVPLVASLGPGATAVVDVPMSVGTASGPVGRIGIPVPPAVYQPASAQTAVPAMVTLAATEVAVRPGEWALVGQVDRTDTLRVSGERPTSIGRAFVVEPALLASADTAGGAAPARLVSTYGASSGPVVQVFEQAVPQGLTRGVAVLASLQPGKPIGVPAAATIEVYDWSARTWNPAAAGAPLTAGEVAGGVVRARVSTDGSPITLALSDVS